MEIDAILRQDVNKPKEVSLQHLEAELPEAVASRAHWAVDSKGNVRSRIEQITLRRNLDNVASDINRLLKEGYTADQIFGTSQQPLL